MKVGYEEAAAALEMSEEETLQQMVRTRGSWEMLYHLSDNRENLIRWLPVKQEANALEVSCQCGALTGALAQEYAHVTAWEPEAGMLQVARQRYGRERRIDFIQSSWRSFTEGCQESFDDIYLVDGLPRAQEWCESPEPYRRLLCDVFRMTENGGRLILAIENKLGLRYWAGCQEEQNGGYYINIENYPNGEACRTFSKRELLDMLKEAGFSRVDCYYPYPDIYFPTTIYSDDYLPRPGELLSNITNYDRDRYLFFDEAKVYDTLIQEGLYPQFANGFLMIAGKA